jgi:hypothetical protein
MPFSSNRSLPPRGDSTSTMQVAAAPDAGVSSSTKAAGAICACFFLARFGCVSPVRSPSHFFRLFASSRKQRQTGLTPRRLAISAAACHSSSGKWVRGGCLLRNSAKRFRSSSSSSYPPLYVSRILASGLPPSADATNFHRLKSRTLAETTVAGNKDGENTHECLDLPGTRRTVGTSQIYQDVTVFPVYVSYWERGNNRTVMDERFRNGRRRFG